MRTSTHSPHTPSDTAIAPTGSRYTQLRSAAAAVRRPVCQILPLPI